MKKRKWVLPVCIVGGVISLCLVLAVAFIGYMGITGYGMTAGYLYIGDAGTFLVEDNDTSMKLSDQSAGKNVFDGLNNGDKVIVIHDGVEETFPARTGAYHIVRLSKGSENYKPSDEALGISTVHLYDWTNSDNMKEVSHNKGYGDISVQLPNGWTSTAVDDSNTDFSIYIWPENQFNGKLRLRYTNSFGVCGTGLEQHKITIGNYEAWQGTYDNAQLWDFISFIGTAGNYVIMNEGTDVWWDEYEDEAMHIFNTIEISEGVITESEAVEIAKAKATVEYNETKATFDMAKGVWTVMLSKKDTAGGNQDVQIDSDGNIIDMSWGE